MKTLTDVDLAAKTVLLRSDLNVPVRDGRITNDKRIESSLPTIRAILEAGGRAIIMSHLGRPAGKGFEPAYSMRPVATRLGERLGLPVALGPESVIGPELDRMVGELPSCGVLLLENLRFHGGETVADEAAKAPDGKLTPAQTRLRAELARGLAKHGDIYVNDAFGTCHREHVSMYDVPVVFRESGRPAVAGLLVAEEIRHLGHVLGKPARPFVAILGGAKVSDKATLIAALLQKVDRLLIGGAMAYTLLRARGVATGKSRVEEDLVPAMAELLKATGDKILLPRDHVASDRYDSKQKLAGQPVSVDAEGVPDDLLGLDIGPATAAGFGEVIRTAGTILWNGPMGVSELADYAAGTTAVAHHCADAADAGAMVVVGGGDSAAAVERLGLDSRMTHVSTGGGACLEYLEGKPLPALTVLDA